jgi:hypothetical protein
VNKLRAWWRGRQMGDALTVRRLHWLRTCPPENLVFLYRPGMERWTPEQYREEGEAVRALAVPALEAELREMGMLP